MEEYLNSIVQRIKSDNSNLILESLKDIQELRQGQLITPEIVDFLFPLLTPLLIHTNYKIRLISFEIETYFLTDFRDYIYNSYNAFPNVISSLSSVNKKIVSMATECASVIMNIEYPINWWSELEQKLTTSRSFSQKLIILDLLVEHIDEIHHSTGETTNFIPIEFICKLLTDPKIQIQKKAMYILEQVRKEDLDSSLHAAEGQLGISREHSGILSPKIKVEQRALRNRQVFVDNSFQNQYDSQLSENSQRSKKTQKSHLSMNSKNSKNFLGSSNLNDENNPFNSSSSRSLLRSSKASHASRSSRASCLSQQTNSEIHLNHSKEAEIVIKEEKPLEENVGEFPVQQSRAMTFNLKDLAPLQWQERYVFLQKVDNLLQKHGKLQIPPAQLVDCVLTASFPINKQVAPLLCKILSDVLPQNPELISLFKKDILKFVLLGIRIFNDQTPFQLVTDVLFQEGNPNEIINTAINIANSEKRSLHLESYFISLFEGESEVVLEKQALFNLLCYLIHRAYPEDVQLSDKQPEHFENLKKILYYTSSHQKNLFQEFIGLQTQKAKAILDQFLVNDEVSCTKPYKKTSNLINYENPLETINKEFRKGEKSNLLLIADAFVQVDFCSLRRTEIVFNDLIKFLSVLSQGKVQRHINEIRRICAHFTSPQLLNIIESEKVVPDLIFGVAIFVWNCSKLTIERCDNFYPKLYSIFKRADGEIREQVILIEMAISKASNKPFVNLSSIPDFHKKLILKIENQFLNPVEEEEEEK